MTYQEYAEMITDEFFDFTGIRKAEPVENNNEEEQES